MQNLINSIYFEQATLQHEEIIFKWLAKPHIQEFWDNSQEHKDDILNFINGQKQHYFYGTTQYWVGFIDKKPYCFLLTDEMLSFQEMSDLQRRYLSKTGHTIALDFAIGNKDCLGKGLAAFTLNQFMTFFQQYVDHLADTFFIDPNENNLRAMHVYEKAGFKWVGDYEMNKGAFKKETMHLLVKQLESLK